MTCVCPADFTDFSTNGNGTIEPTSAQVTETLNSFLHSSCSLFPTFAKVGLFTFGEGYAMISLIGDTCIREMVSRPSG